MGGERTHEELESTVFESEERFRAVVQSSPMGMHLYRLTDDDQLVFSGANPAADRILGVENRTFVGQTIEEAFPALAETEIPGRYREVCHTGIPWRTEQVEYEDGRIHGAFDVHAFRIGERAMAALFLDVTEQRSNQQALADSHEEQRRLVELAPFGITTTDSQGRIVHFNPHAARLHDCTNSDDLVGRHWLELVAPQDRERARSDFEQLLKTGAVGPVEYLLRRCAGTVFNGVVSATLRHAADETPRGVVIIARDVSDEKRQEGLLELQRDLAQRLNELTSTTPALELCLSTALAATSLDAGGVYLLDGETGVLTLACARGVSSAFRRLVGRIPTDDPRMQLVRRGIPAYVPYALVSADDRSLREGLRVMAVVPLVHEGRIIGCLNAASHTSDHVPLADRHVLESVAAQLAGALARLDAVDALRRKEASYRLLVENQSDLIIKMDRAGSLLFVSPSFCQAFGMRREELLDHTFWALVCESDRAAAARSLGELDSPPHQVYFEHQADTVLGRRWFAWRGTAVLGGQGEVAEIIGVGRDITDKRRAEDALRYRSRFEELLSDVSTRFVNVAAGDIGNQIEEALGGFASLCGSDGAYVLLAERHSRAFTVAYAAGPRGLAIKQTDPAHLLEPVDWWLPRFRAGTPVPTSELDELPPEREEIRGVMRALDARSFVDVPLVYGEAFIGIVRFFTSEQRQWTEDELHLLKMLGQLVANALRRQQSERSLQALQEQLLQSQKMEAIGRLAGGVAHDFNNLLTGIIGYAEMAMSSLQEDEPLYEDLGEIYSAAHRAAGLTSQLLAFSRRQVVELQELNLNAVVRDSQRMLGRIIGEDVELVFQPGQGLGSVRTDPAQVDQILVNLATNSRDAMPDGGRLVIGTSNVEVDEEYGRLHPDAQAGGYVMLSVHDNGAGMDFETRRRAFEPFFSTKDKDKGTGLGLSTVYGIVRQHNGFIDVYSEPGLGTTIKIYFPRVADTAETANCRVPRRAAPGGDELVLLVEDETMVRDLAHRILARRGYQVIDASGGQEALLLAEQESESIDVLVTDVVMPKMNGRELFERLRRQRPGLRVVFMSGYTDDVIAQHGVLEPGTSFVQKPFSADSLLRKVREALDDPAPAPGGPDDHR